MSIFQIRTFIHIEKDTLNIFLNGTLREEEVLLFLTIFAIQSKSYLDKNMHDFQFFFHSHIG